MDGFFFSTNILWNWKLSGLLEPHVACLSLSKRVCQNGWQAVKRTAMIPQMPCNTTRAPQGSKAHTKVTLVVLYSIRTSFWLSASVLPETVLTCQITGRAENRTPQTYSLQGLRRQQLGRAVSDNKKLWRRWGSETAETSSKWQRTAQVPLGSNGLCWLLQHAIQAFCRKETRVQVDISWHYGRLRLRLELDKT